MKNPNRKVFLTCAFALFVFTACKKDMSVAVNSEIDPVIETSPAIHTPVTVKVDDNCGGYYEALPARYDSSSKKYPLILFMHGIGELGNGSSDLPKMIRTGLPWLIHKQKFPAAFESGGEHYSFIVISPQFRKWPTNQEVNNVLRHVIQKYRVDTSRVYVTGLSMGGGVTWDFTAAHGASLAAIAPICGGSRPDINRAKNIAAANVAVWAFHNEDDKAVPVAFSVDYVNRINSFKPPIPARVTTWPTGGHNSWTKAYDPEYRENGKNMYEWMLQYQRSKK